MSSNSIISKGLVDVQGTTILSDDVIAEEKYGALLGTQSELLTSDDPLQKEMEEFTRNFVEPSSTVLTIEDVNINEDDYFDIDLSINSITIESIGFDMIDSGDWYLHDMMWGKELLPSDNFVDIASGISEVDVYDTSNIGYIMPNVLTESKRVLEVGPVMKKTK